MASPGRTNSGPPETTYRPHQHDDVDTDRQLKRGPIRSVSIFGASPEDEPEQQRVADEGKLLADFNAFSRRIRKYTGGEPDGPIDVVILAGALTDVSLAPLAGGCKSRWVLPPRARVQSTSALLASSGAAASSSTPAAVIFRDLPALVVEARTASEAFERALVAICLCPRVLRPESDVESCADRQWAVDGIRWSCKMRRRRLDTARHEMHTHLDTRLVLLAAEDKARTAPKHSMKHSASAAIREHAKTTDEGARKEQAERDEAALATEWIVEAMRGGHLAAMYRPALTSLFDYLLEKHGRFLRGGLCGRPDFVFAAPEPLTSDPSASTPFLRGSRRVKTVADIAAGWRRWLRERFARAEESAGLLWLLWRVARGAAVYPGMLSLLFLGLLCQSVLEIAVPLSLKLVVDQITAKDTHALMWTAVALACAVCLSFAGGCLYFHAAAELASRIVRDTQNKMVKHLLSLPDLFYEGTTDTALLSHFTNDGISFETAVVRSFDTLKSSMNLLFFSALLFKLDPRIAPAVLLLQLVIINAPSFFRARGQAASRDKLRAASTSIGVAQDIIRGQDVIRQYEVQAEFMDRFMESVEATRVHARSFFFNSRMYLEMYVVLNTGLNLAVLLAGGALVLQGWTGLAELLAIHNCASKIGTAAKLVFGSVPDLLRGLGGLQRIEGLLWHEASGRVKLYDIFARSRRLIASEARRTMSPPPRSPNSASATLSPPGTPFSPAPMSPVALSIQIAPPEPGDVESGGGLEKAPSTLRRLFSVNPAHSLRGDQFVEERVKGPPSRQASEKSDAGTHTGDSPVTSFTRTRSRWRRGSAPDQDSEPLGGVQAAIAAFSVPGELEISELLFSPRLPDGRPAQYLSSLEAERLVELRMGPDLRKITLPSGSFTSFVGSAAALQTLADLLLASLHPTAGRIRYNGCPAHPVIAVEWRKHVAVISEEPFIFADSVRGNVCLWDDHADDDRVVEALSKAGLSEFADRNALNTAVSPRTLGSNARRALAFARALYRRPRIVLLRDTSLGAPQVAVLREEGAVVVQLSGRVDRAAEADAVVVLADGELAEQGTFEALRAGGKHFPAMLRSQQSFTVSPDSTASCPLERLRALEPFAVPDPGPAEEAALADVGSALTSESFARGQLLCREGDPARRFFLVAAGSVVVTQVNLDGSVRRCGVLQPSDYFWVPPPESGRGTPSAPSSPLAGIIDSAGSAHTDAEGAPAAYRHTLEAATNTIVLTMDAGQLLALLTPRMRRHAADLAAARRARARWKVAREKIGGVATFLSVRRSSQLAHAASTPAVGPVGGPGAALPAAVELRPAFSAAVSFSPRAEGAPAPAAEPAAAALSRPNSARRPAAAPTP